MKKPKNLEIGVIRQDGEEKRRCQAKARRIDRCTRPTKWRAYANIKGVSNNAEVYICEKHAKAPNVHYLTPYDPVKF